MAAYIAGAVGLLSSCVSVPVTSLAGCVACQACSCLASGMCSCLCSALFCSSKKEDVASRSARLTYLLMFIIATVVAGVLRDESQLFIDAASRSDIFSQNMKCPPDNTSKNCMGRVLVLRICFGTFIFHLIMTVLTLGAHDFSNPRVLIHTGLWPLKIVLWIMLHVMTFFISSDVFLGFQWPALICAVFFLLIQTIIFIEWIFELNESWINKDGADNLKGPWHLLIVFISLFCLAGSIVASGFMFKWFGPDSGGNNCGLFTFFTAFNVFLFIGLTLFSFKATSWMPATGLLPSSLVTAFLTFKVLMALYAQNQCNALSVQQGSSYGSPEIVNAISIIIAILVAAYSSVALSQDMGDDGRFWGPASKSEDSPAVPPLTINTQQDRSTPLLQPPQHTVIEMHATSAAVKPGEVSPQVGGVGGDAAGPGAAAAAELGEKGPVGYSIAAFHLAFMLGMCYVTMQLTEWNEQYSSGGATVSMWIKIADAWVLGLAYAWAMIAPLVCTGRDFN